MEPTPQPKKKRSTIKIVLLSLLLLIVLAAGIGWWYWTTHKKGIIKNKLEQAIANKSKGLYKVTYDSLDFDEISGWLKVYNMNLAYDTLKYAQSDSTAPLLFSIQIPFIHINGVKTPRALIDDEIVARKLEINDPVVKIEYTYKGKDSARNVPTKEVYEQILGNLDLIQVDTIIINNAQLQTLNKNTGKKIVAAEGLSVTLSDVRVDSAAFMDESRYLFAKDILISAKKVNWDAPGNLYTFAVENIQAGSAGKTLEIGSFLFKPTLGENAFVNAIPTQDDRFDFSFRNIKITNVDITRLQDEYLSADTLLVGGSTFKIYRDLARPRDKKNRVGYYPHQVLDDVPFRFNIRKVVVPNSFVEYKERNHITRESGKVQFHDVNAVLTNFTNDKNAVKAGETMTATVNSRFLNATPFYSQWTFYLFHPNGRFDVAGNMGAIDTKLLNPLAEPMGPASFKQGKMNKLEFKLEGTDYQMKAHVKALYEDLKVVLLEKDKGATTTDKKSFMTLLANFIIKNDNPKRNEAPREVDVVLERDTNRSAFWLCWKTLFKGLRETVGIKK